MEGSHFDQLTKRLATQRVTRLTALRGLALGALAALTGAGLLGEEAGAKNKKGEKKIRICHRTSASDVGVTKRLKKSKAKKELRRHPFDTRGRCSATPAPGPQCTNNNDCTGGLVCIGQQCVACTLDAQCPGGQVCISGRCQTPVTPPECQTNNQCSGGQVCVGGACVACTLTSQCAGQVCLGSRCVGGEACMGDAPCEALSPLLGCETAPPDSPLLNTCVLANPIQCFDNTGCSAPEFCLLGECVRDCGPTLPACVAPEQCISGVCINPSQAA
jgi:Cys-rich repeat protein